jgi:hypothetical protein
MRKLKEIISFIFKPYFEIWYIPVLVGGVFGLMGLFFLPTPSKIMLYILLGLPFFSLLASGLIGLFRLIKKQYMRGVLQIAATVIVLFMGFFIINSVLRYYPHDYYADNLEMPKNIPLEMPIEDFSAEEDEKILNLPPENQKFILQNGYQPGLYTYYVWLNPKEKGSVYLKAYEITKNNRLSEQDLTKKSHIEIDTLAMKVYQKGFTIYEGDWEKPYGARFELWFKPKGEGKEYLLSSKNYQIEGWMR